MLSCDDKCKVAIGQPAVHRLNNLRKYFEVNQMPEMPDHDYRGGGTLVPCGYLKLEFEGPGSNVETSSNNQEGPIEPIEGEVNENRVEIDANPPVIRIENVLPQEGAVVVHVEGEVNDERVETATDQAVIRIENIHPEAHEIDLSSIDFTIVGAENNNNFIPSLPQSLSENVSNLFNTNVQISDQNDLAVDEVFCYCQLSVDKCSICKITVCDFCSPNSEAGQERMCTKCFIQNQVPQLDGIFDPIPQLDGNGDQRHPGNKYLKTDSQILNALDEEDSPPGPNSSDDEEHGTGIEAIIGHESRSDPDLHFEAQSLHVESDEPQNCHNAGISEIEIQGNAEESKQVSDEDSRDEDYKPDEHDDEDEDECSDDDNELIKNVASKTQTSKRCFIDDSDNDDEIVNDVAQSDNDVAQINECPEINSAGVFKTSQKTVVGKDGRLHYETPNTGESFVFIRSTDFVGTTIQQHVNDIIAIYKNDSSPNRKRVMTIVVDDGADYSIKSSSTIHLFGRLWLEIDLGRLLKGADGNMYTF